MKRRTSWLKLGFRKAISRLTVADKRSVSSALIDYHCMMKVKAANGPVQGWPILWSLFPLELRGSNRFRKVKPPRTPVKFNRMLGFQCLTMLRTGTEPPRTPVKFNRRLGFPCWTMVRTGSEELNNPILMRNYLMILVPSGAQRFDEVR